MSVDGLSNIERDYEHWVCPTCDSVDGPTDGYACVICREESRNSKVEGLVPASQHRGAVEDRDKLAAYVCWRFAPFGEAPTTLDDLCAMLTRLGYHPAGGQS